MITTIIINTSNLVILIC